ncbi:tRNA (mnm(5)s(2)U34)-methyltransferase [Lactococcus allomyrinae]|uniref:SAM-dependent methyltransferase n=1 Tax=Lactococcus allomyrinae TaxID=2419773 RepID=A0A387BC00_9LACT|nr:class I SAM-dependent methyltransferase [Lactococcus allomyrinae]AYG01385.1 SAM-dependent methyltransferase [Lactococcus allomyrinae]
MLKALAMAHSCLEEIIKPNDIVVDATMGNGYDTLFLSNLTDNIFAFDVQNEAIEATEKRLSFAGKNVIKISDFENEKLLTENPSVKLILDGHENVRKYVKKPIKAAIFNLGYLPKADKTVITKPDTTLTALSSLTELLVTGGRIALMIYYGHEGGEKEKNAVIHWVSTLNQKTWDVFTYGPLNQVHTPPILVILEKK